MFSAPTLSASFLSTGRAKKASAAAKQPSTSDGATPWLARTRKPVSSQLRATWRARAGGRRLAARKGPMSRTGMRPAAVAGPAVLLLLLMREG
jgi:hypothetical protein